MSYGAETWIPCIVMIVVLIWGLRLLTVALQQDGASAEKTSLIAGALRETNDNANKASFSRVAGAIGAMALASFMAGLGLWIFFAINMEEATHIDRLPKLSTFFLGGSALFAPYAFNQLSKVFKTS